MINTPTSVSDIPFQQEYHMPHFPKGLNDANIRNVAVDDQSNIWIATSEGIFKKHINAATWEKMVAGLEDGPAYTVLYDDTLGIWVGTWKGLFHYNNNAFKRMADTQGPISVLCATKEGVYAFGPKDVWLCNLSVSVKKNIKIAKSVRAAIADSNGGVWIGTDVGLYHYAADQLKYYFDTSYLVSAYVKGVAVKENTVWVGGLGGVAILKNHTKSSILKLNMACHLNM